MLGGKRQAHEPHPPTLNRAGDFKIQCNIMSLPSIGAQTWAGKLDSRVVQGRRAGNIEHNV
ncbi:hypothetical protein LPTSP3_g29610 [Leptospira kobayashii]|uniref:Uncharacterized protein n=1 Tax=Leptospira kobayashii TaxID=1917830 RepID=A0ABN6KLK6_9LEPT|nr:hypothetical protein LPTSP3_g29610 [Leptospira kobayashii]